MKNIKKIIIMSAIIALFSCLQTVSAASLYFSTESNEVKKDDVFVVNVNLSSVDQKINVADCSLFFDNNILQVAGISTGGSVFSLWTRSPVFSNENGVIIFTGGIPNGFSGANGKLLKIVFLAKESGQANISFSDSTALYLNDGNGTKIDPNKENIAVKVSDRLPTEKHSDAWYDILTNDKNQPRNLEVKLARDYSVFDNKFFIVFSGIDDESGIKSYFVKEGNGDFIESESPYVLKDQSLRSAVFVKAVDKSGNYTIIKLEKPIYLSWIFWITIIVLLVIIIVCVLKRKYAKK